jgi:hypothetical protein
MIDMHPPATFAAANKLKLLPKRALFLKDKALPKFMKSKAEQADPIRKKLRTETELPSASQSKTDITPPEDPPICALPSKLNPLPNRATARKLKELAQLL